MKLPRWLHKVRLGWRLYHLTEPEFASMYAPEPEGEWVAIDCETTGLDVRRDRIVSIGAVRIVGDRLMTSQRLELRLRPDRALAPDSVRVHLLRESDVAHGMEPAPAMRELLRYIGSRPLVGYYLAFDVAMLNREVWRLLGVRLPQRRIEVSALYYDLKNRRLPPLERGNVPIDLRFATLLGDLGVPVRPAHVALNDAVMAGLAFIKLRHLLGEGKAAPGRRR